MTGRPLSPIEMMVDHACGLAPSARPTPSPTITLECPMCGRTKPAPLHKSDPPGTARVLAICNECPEEAPIVDYFDALGRQIDLDGNPLPSPSPTTGGA